MVRAGVVGPSSQRDQAHPLSLLCCLAYEVARFAQPAAAKGRIAARQVDCSHCLRSSFRLGQCRENLIQPGIVGLSGSKLQLDMV